MSRPSKIITAISISILGLLMLNGSSGIPVSIHFDKRFKNYQNQEGNIASQDSVRKSNPSDSQVITLQELQDSLEYYRDNNNQLGIARSYHQLGDLHLKLQNPSDAIAHYMMAGNQYEQLNKKNRAIEVYNAIAALYLERDHFDKALEYANRARELSGQIQDDSLKAIAAFQMGKIYEEVGQYRQAEDSYGVALDLYRRYDRSATLSDMYHHMAEVQEELGRRDQALDLHQQALAIRKDLDDSAKLAESYSQIGSLFAARDDLDQAIDYHQRAADMRQELNNPIDAAQNYVKIGELHINKGNYDQALDYANRALKIANSFDALELKVAALNLALSTHARLGNLDMVTSLQERLAELQDSLEDLKQEQQQQNLAFRLETQEKIDSLQQLQASKEVQQAQLEREHLYLIIAIIGVISLIIILVLLNNRYQYRKHQEGLLLKKNEELETLNERLEALNEEKNEIFQTVTHDMKNPLSGIIGLADLATSDADSISREDLLEYMEQIEQAGRNMDDMVRKLLDIRTIESGKYNLDMKPSDLNQTLEGVVNNNIQLAQNKDIEIVKDLGDEDEVVMGDQTAIQRILDNLVSNAIKYSPQGKKIYLNMYRNNGNVRVEVKDEGPGIKPEEYSKLFSKFGRLSSQPTGGEHTTGLGLYIAKQLTQQMDGNIGCDSAPGAGATFYIELKRTTLDEES